jgi:hypothetical protein
MLSVVNEPNMECHYAECRCAECRYTECRSALTSSLTFVEKAGAYPQSKSRNSLLA